MVSSKHDHDMKARVRQEQHNKNTEKKAENSGHIRMDRHPGDGASLKATTKKGGNGTGNWGRGVNKDRWKLVMKKVMLCSLGAEIEEGKTAGGYRPTTEQASKLQLD